MGMDARIIVAHSKKELETDGFWEYLREHEWEEQNLMLGEKWYARKFWDLHNSMSFLQDYECGDYIELSKKNLDEMLQYATHHRDYFDGFESVIDLCELLDRYDEFQAAGLHLFYECDW